MIARNYLRIEDTEVEPKKPANKIKAIVLITLILLVVGFVSYRIVKTSNRFPNPTNAIYFPEQR